MPTYQVIVNRTDLSVCTGTLRFLVDNVERFVTPCWEDPDRLIVAKDYHSCSATIMAARQFKSVLLPDDQTDRIGIFIHQGSQPSHSDGCIVCARARVEEIYNTVTPKDAHNVVVRVTNPA